MKLSGKVLEFALGGKTRKYILGAVRYGHLRNFTVSEPFDARTGVGEQRMVIPSHAKHLKKEMTSGSYVPTTFSLGTRIKHREAVSVVDGVATLEVSDKNKLPLIDGGNRTEALENLRSEGGALEKVIDNLHIPYILYLDGNTREDFVALQAGKPVSRDHMLSVRISAGLVDHKQAPYFNIATAVAQILHTDKSSFCHNLIQFDSSGTKLPISLNSVCTKGASDLAFSLYGGAKIAVNYKKDAKWLAKCILLAYKSLRDDPDGSSLLEKGNILAPVPEGTNAGTSLIIGLGNMLAARLMFRQTEEPDQTDLDLLVGYAAEHLNVKTRGNTSADSKRSLLNNFVKDFFYDLVAKPTDEEDVDENIDVPTKAVGSHEGIPVPLIRLLSPSTFNVSKLPTEPRKRGRKKKDLNVVITVPRPSTEESGEATEEIAVGVDDSKVSSEDPIDAKAFAEDDAKAESKVENTITCEEIAPWDNSDSEEDF